MAHIHFPTSFRKQSEFRSSPENATPVGTYQSNFIIAQEYKPKIDVDYLEKYGLLVDLKCKRLIDTDRYIYFSNSTRSRYEAPYDSIERAAVLPEKV